MIFKSGFESRESQFNTAGGSEFQVGGAAVLNKCLANDVRRNGICRNNRIDAVVSGRVRMIRNIGGPGCTPLGSLQQTT